jgi:hypothetical protein
MSCAASGMELILKLHGLVPIDFRGLQDKYQDTNIGFEKLDDLREYGITAKPEEVPFDEGMRLIESEIDRGHFPLVSLGSSVTGWYIWIAVRENESVRFLSKGFAIKDILEQGRHEASQILAVHRRGLINFATYELPSHQKDDVLPED